MINEIARRERSKIFNVPNQYAKIKNKRKLIFASLIFISLGGCNEVSQDTLQAVSELWPVVEIGREGACANAGYIY
ncbi:MAG: hypothetical protein ACKPFF_15155, partial [Planktothrix sp.]